MPELRRRPRPTGVGTRIAGDVPALSGGNIHNNHIGGGTRTGRHSNGKAGTAGGTVVGLRNADATNRPDLDVRRDTKRTSCLVIGLAVIGGLGVGGLACALWWGVLGAGRQIQTSFRLAVPLLALLFLAGLSTLIVFVRSRGNPGAAVFVE